MVQRLLYRLRRALNHLTKQSSSKAVACMSGSNVSAGPDTMWRVHLRKYFNANSGYTYNVQQDTTYTLVDDTAIGGTDVLTTLSTLASTATVGNRDR